MNRMSKKDIFVGRKVELDQFTQAIRPSSKVASIVLGSGHGVQSRVFQPYGVSGMGKTWLARKCLSKAKNLGWQTAEIDWDAANYRPTDIYGLMTSIAQIIRDKYGEKPVHEFFEILNQVKENNVQMQRHKKENQERWESFVEWARKGVEGTVSLTTDDNKGEAAGKVVDAAGAAVGVGATWMAKAEDSFIEWLIDRGTISLEQASISRDPNKELARVLVNGLLKATKEKPLAVLFDTCEILPIPLEEWLRDAIVTPAAKGDQAIIFFLAGQQNQHLERRVKAEDGSIIPVKGYADRLTSPPPILWDLSRFADPDIEEYLQIRGLEPDDELIEFVQSMAIGVPFAVQLITDAILKIGVDSVREKFSSDEPGKITQVEEMVTLVTRRFLRYCVDEMDLQQVRGLAILREWDDKGLRAIWSMNEDLSPQVTLSNLEAKYAFILPGGKLHEIVQKFLRRELRTVEKELAGELGKSAGQVYYPQWQTIREEITSIKGRVVELKWKNSSLSTQSRNVLKPAK